MWLCSRTYCLSFLGGAKLGTVVAEVWSSSFWFFFIDETCSTRDWCSVLLVDFRGADAPPCDVKTGQDSRWRLQYDVYQYFLPENDLTEEALLRHLQRMAEVPQVQANALKVNLTLIICVARLWCLCKSWEGEKLPGAFFFSFKRFSWFFWDSHFFSFISLSPWESLLVISLSNVGFWGDACKLCHILVAATSMTGNLELWMEVGGNFLCTPIIIRLEKFGKSKGYSILRKNNVKLFKDIYVTFNI